LAKASCDRKFMSARCNALNLTTARSGTANIDDLQLQRTYGLSAGLMPRQIQASAFATMC
jgi:hypothetical protein